MHIMPSSPGNRRYGLGFCLSILAHSLIVLSFILVLRDPFSPVTPPAAIMLEFSPQLQVSNQQPEVPLGISQQQKAEASVAENTPEKEEIHRVVKAEDAELQQQKQRKATMKPAKSHDVKQHNLLKQEAVQGNATASNRAAPQPQQTLASKTAAPVESDAAKVRDSKLSWEGLVKGKLNLVKSYPADAKRRGRAGEAVVSFVVSATGEVLSKQLIRSSDTISLDREALAMLERAQPLPQPPAAILVGGSVKVTMPVSFDLTQAN